MSGKILLFCAVLVGCVSVFGEISEKELKKYRKTFQISGVRSGSKEHAKKEYEFLEIQFSGGDAVEDAQYVDNTWLRFTAEVTDKKTKQTYLAKIYEQNAPIRQEGGNQYNTYSGEGYWTFWIPQTEQLSRLKVTAYSLELGVMDGKNFVPYCEKFNGVKSYEELIERTKTPYPQHCDLGRVIFVEN
jgi:hypothetical protein